MGFDYINKWKKQRRKRKTDLKMLQHGLMNRTKHYGSDIFQKPNFKKTAKFVQHGDVSVRKHSISVALTALRISHMLPFHTNDKAIVRGALLHDYLLYDWHKNKIRPSRFYKFYELHGFTHPGTALKNAKKDFRLTPREQDIIKKHMWPLTVIPPMCREAWIVTAADKYCSLMETLHLHGKKTKK